MQPEDKMDWKIVLDDQRKIATRPFHLGYYWQGKYRLDNPVGNEHAAIRRAKSVAYMLDHLQPNIHPQQMFLGGNEIFQAQSLPQGISQEDYDQAIKAIHSEGGFRNFTTASSHTAYDAVRLFNEGLGGLAKRTRAQAQKPGAPPISIAMDIVVQAVIRTFRRFADEIKSTHPEAAGRIAFLADGKPRDMAEAIQLLWLVFCLIYADGDRYANALARLDQYLEPYYNPEEDTLDMLCHLWTKVDGFRSVTNICIGGVKQDGTDAVNPLSFLMLKATHLVHSPYTNLSARIGPSTPDEFLLACIELIATGIGFPAIFNDNNNIKMLEKLGIPIEDARDYALFGCVEPLVPGKQVAWSDGRFSMPSAFRRAVLTLENIDTYEQLFDLFVQNMRDDMAAYAERYNNALKSQPVDTFPDPFLSAFVSDCVDRQLDINDGGAIYPRFHGVGMMGLATITDGLAAIKKLVFEEGKIDKAHLVKAIENNFENDEPLRQLLINGAPKYGNDDEYCDDIARKVVKICGEICLEQPVHGGGFLLSAMASNINNIPAGKELGATPDGRFAGMPLSDAASPSAGRDRNGPTAFVNSIVKPDYTQQSCTVVNMRFQPETLKTQDGKSTLLAIFHRFIDAGGQEMQFNVTNQQDMIDAMSHPEKAKDLIVRVSGFSEYFVRLSTDVQKDILRRTSH
jgi:formate C-acetyltransferase